MAFTMCRSTTANWLALPGVHYWAIIGVPALWRFESPGTRVYFAIPLDFIPNLKSNHSLDRSGRSNKHGRTGGRPTRSRWWFKLTAVYRQPGRF